MGPGKRRAKGFASHLGKNRGSGVMGTGLRGEFTQFAIVLSELLLRNSSQYGKIGIAWSAGVELQRKALYPLKSRRRRLNAPATRFFGSRLWDEKQNRYS